MPLIFKKWILGLSALCSMACCQEAGTLVDISRQDVTIVQFIVEIADTPAKRGEGLMFRDQLPEGQGMYFVFPSESQNPFWMKNTPLSLDIIFAKGGTIVDIIDHTTPYSEELLTPQAEYDRVLEVLAGIAEKEKIQIGDAMDLR